MADSSQEITVSDNRWCRKPNYQQLTLMSWIANPRQNGQIPQYIRNSAVQAEARESFTIWRWLKCQSSRSCELSFSFRERGSSDFASDNGCSVEWEDWRFAWCESASGSGLKTRGGTPTLAYLSPRHASFC